MTDTRAKWAVYETIRSPWGDESKWWIGDFSTRKEACAAFCNVYNENSYISTFRIEKETGPMYSITED